VSVYRIPIFFVRWSPPVKPPAEESAFGREIDARAPSWFNDNKISSRWLGTFLLV
jgi:hypothetical protein